MPPDLTDDKSALVQVMTWFTRANVDPDLCRQMASLDQHSQVLEMSTHDLPPIYTPMFKPCIWGMVSI